MIGGMRTTTALRLAIAVFVGACGSPASSTTGTADTSSSSAGSLATAEPVAEIGFETGVHGLAAAAGSIWVLDLHGPSFLGNLKGSTVWRLDPAGIDR